MQRGDTVQPGDSPPRGDPLQAQTGSLRTTGPLLFWSPFRPAEWPWLGALVTTRRGGTSLPPYAELNLGLSTGDLPERVDANRTLLRRNLGLDSHRWHRLRQVHGDRIVAAGTEVEPAADGHWTQDPGHVLVVGVADCVPVYLWDSTQRRVALVHAGWRGTAAGVVPRAIESLERAGSAPSDLWMAMGPSIGPCCYEVGSEVASRFPAAALRGDGSRPHLDLRQVNRRQAIGAGLDATRILPDPPCTACRNEIFFSHRRLGPRTGRLWALAWIREPEPPPAREPRSGPEPVPPPAAGAG